ncbi:gliding motility associated protein GldN [Mesonia hippocampi]|uniref:Gliding motility associated protein GldN n=1 Tax=Mesonia hippocampi TaxID=1628250 RepID=A0A840EQ56_9FLAO|nr:gliding motility protein GldN [Mesonia hippocampi]MBB4118733.1 gliding motility associated protein GldN [Mesonia hippocampi]
MKLKSLFAAVLIGFAGTSAFAQLNILNAKSPDEIGKKTQAQIENDNDEPLPYGYVGERDILWGKTVWEYIDLDERINIPLLYPLDTGRLGNERMSLFQVLLTNIRNGEIKNVYADSYFNRKRTLEELGPTLSRRDTLSQGYAQLNAGEALDPQFIRRTDIDGSDVQGYRIRGYWYFDKRQGDLRYRLLGICPMVVDAYAKSQNNEDAKPVELFWVFYPEARKVMHKAMAFNTDNSSEPITFDHLLNSRRFNGVIYKDDNMYGDREIEEYVADNALMQLLESDRIKESVRNFESYMWSY